MPDRSRKRKPKKAPPEDMNQAAARILATLTGGADADPEGQAETLPPPPKNAAAVALGKLGGAKGGPARAAKLSPKRRAAIAKKAAKARWNSK